MIRPDQLQRLAPAIAPSVAVALAPLLTAEGARCGIDTGPRIAAWLAQIRVETWGFTRFVEDLDYDAAGLAATWPSRFPPALAHAYARQPQRIADRAYASRMGNGDEASGDGWRFRGRGLLQITGRANYAQAAAFTGLNLVDDPDPLGAPGLAAARAAADFWRVHGLNALADAGDIAGVSRAINGGLNGLDPRRAAFEQARAIWPD